MEGMFAFCKTCYEVRPHEIADPGSCTCHACGTVQIIIGEGPVLAA